MFGLGASGYEELEQVGTKWFGVRGRREVEMVLWRPWDHTARGKGKRQAGTKEAGEGRVAQGGEAERFKGVWSAGLGATGHQGGLAPEGPRDLPAVILGGEVGVGALLAEVKM